jgi:hypothetical protein
MVEVGQLPSLPSGSFIPCRTMRHLQKPALPIYGVAIVDAANTNVSVSTKPGRLQNQGLVRLMLPE